MKTKAAQFFLLFFGLLIIYLLFQLPTSVVKNNNSEIQETASIETALKLLDGENPMQGIFMLREMVEKNPKNTDALYYLGILSIQTGQYENAIERFNQIISIDSSDKRAYLQLGISNYLLGNVDRADSLFNIVKSANDELLTKEIEDFLTK